MHSIVWSDLQFVLAVAQLGSLSAAARELGVNHATVLRRIQAFETRHGVTLFDRAPSGYRLSPDHAPLMPDLTAIGELVGKLERMLAGQGEAFQGLLRLTTTDTFSRTVLPRHIASFRAAFPDVVLQITVTNSRLDLARMDADLTIRPAVALPEGVAGERIGDLAFRVYGPAAWSRTGPPDAIEWIGPGDALSRSPVGQWLDAEIGQEQIVIRVNSFGAMLDAVERGVGLAMLPCCLGDSSVGAARMAAFDTQVETGLWVAAHQDMAHSRRIQAFLGHFAAGLTQDRALLSGRGA